MAFSIELFLEVKQRKSFWSKSALSGVALAVAKNLRQSRGKSVSLIVIGGAKMRRLNKIYRGKDKETDVLSFAWGEGQEIYGGPPEEIGEVFINLAAVARQAKEYAVSEKQEFNRLLVHGVLHLFGFDHERSSKDEKIMFALAEKILLRIA